MAAAFPSPLRESTAVSPARVLIVDDSAVARAVIARVVDSSAQLTVAGSVPTARAAMAFLAKNTVDFILLDIEMPGVDGLTALPDIIAAARGGRIIVVSSIAHDAAAVTLQALALGAIDKVVKPAPGIASARFADTLRNKLEHLAGNLPPVAASPPIRPIQDGPDVTPDGFDPAAYDVVAIGASTGGIHALSILLRGLSSKMTLPILITQHLPPSFMPYFAAQLTLLSGRTCDVATDCMRIRRGRIILAPGDAHLRCVRLSDGGAALRLAREPSVSGCMPSVDPMLSSVADVYGRRALAVMLSGMGRDGLDGARAIRDAGGCVLAQDRATSVVWGMPGAVVQAGIAAAQCNPAAIGQLIARCGKP